MTHHDRPRRRRLIARWAPLLSTLALSATLGGCNWAVLDPKGSIGLQEKSIILTATGLMLLVVVPVIMLTLIFAWHYRASNTRATYKPKWSHSTAIEVVVWVVPCLIIIALGTLTWTSSHDLDPYKPLAAADKTMTVDVVALDWKWLFYYPKEGIATVNEVAMPVGQPVDFRITSASVMNSFAIPQLGGQIYAMLGMETHLHLVAGQPGVYEGMSANFSGPGFSGMNFKAHAVSQADFAQWVAKVKASGKALDVAAYEKLAAPSEDTPVTYYGSADPKLYHDILMKCFVGGTDTCSQKTAAAFIPGTDVAPIGTAAHHQEQAAQASHVTLAANTAEPKVKD